MKLFRKSEIEVLLVAVLSSAGVAKLCPVASPSPLLRSA